MATTRTSQISEKTAHLVIKSVGEMTDLYKRGSSPQEALEKVAMQNDLQPGLIRIVGRAFNSGQTLSEVNGGKTLAEKTAGKHELVDIESTIQGLFSADRPAPRTDQVAAVYSQPPSGMGKAAAAEPDASPIVPELSNAEGAFDRPPIWVAPHLYNPSEKIAEVIALRHFIQEQDRAHSVAETQMKKAKAALSQEVKTVLGDPQKMANLRADVARFYGDEGSEQLKQAMLSFSKHTIGDRMVKRAMAESSNIRVLPVSQNHPVLVKVAACCSACKKAESAYKSRVANRMMAAKIHRLIDGQDKVAHRVSAVADSYGKQIEEHLHKFAMNLNALMGGLVASKMRGGGGGPSPESNSFREAELQLDDPSHSRNLQNIRLRASLQGLMDYDPVVQAYDPDQVLDAFNELSQSSPTAVDDPVMLRANLRRLLAGDISPFEATQIQSSESDRRKLIDPLTAQIGSGRTAK